MTTLQHYLRPLLVPSSVALVGATGRAGSLGRIVIENLLEGEFKGDLHFVNPHHRRVLGKRCHATLRAIGKPIELALIAVPCAAVPSVLDDGARAGVKAAVLLSAPPGDEGEARRWERDLVATARKRRIRLFGPHAFGVIRTDIGLNATMGAAVAHPGRLALIAQSGAVCTAMLNFATPLGIGFSTVVALGGAYDVGFGELLDALVRDPGTDSILLYVETVRDARGFVSALRAAARMKPVVVLRAGRSNEGGATESGAPSPDAVFDAAMKRAGTVRVMTYTHLFSAARILAMGRIPRSDHLAIVTNGHGPGTLAADTAADRGVPLAVLTKETRAALAGILPAHMSVRESGERARRRDARAVRRGRRCGVARSQRRRRARAARRPASDRRYRRRARGRRGGARRIEAGAGRVARRDRAAQRPQRARGGRHPRLLHAGERGRSVLVPRGLPPQSGLAARGGAAAAGAAPA